MKKVYLLPALAIGLIGLQGCTAMNSLTQQRDNSKLAYTLEDHPSSLATSATFCPVGPTELYMVMPEDEGKVGIVDVTFSDGDTAVLEGEYSAMALEGDKKTVYTGDHEQMKLFFGDSLSGLPSSPIYETLYFLSGSEELVPESAEKADQLLVEITKRQSVEVIIDGHTDTLGTGGYNKALSLKRANVIRDRLIAKGIPANTIDVNGHGEASLLIQTIDNTDEPQNRRVEINVR